MDYYKVLGVAKDASDKDIEDAFRVLAVKHHPDKNPDDKEAVKKFKEIAEAFEALNDSTKRAQYDRFGKAGPQQRPSGHGHFSTDGIDLDSVFKQFFHNAGFGRDTIRGTRVRINIDLKEAAKGCRKQVSVRHHDPCKTCNQTGFENWKQCPACGGAGRVQVQQSPWVISTGCQQCLGRGKIPEVECKDCKGVGHIEGKEEKIDVDVPPGIEHQSQIKIPGQGDLGGDLYVAVMIDKDKMFERTGKNLYCKIAVTYAQLVLGGEVEVSGLEKKIMLKICPGTQSGSRLRLQGEGMPWIQNPNIKGDMYVTLNLHTPVKISKEHRKILKQLEKLEEKSSG